MTTHSGGLYGWVAPFFDLSLLVTFQGIYFEAPPFLFPANRITVYDFMPRRKRVKGPVIKCKSSPQFEIIKRFSSGSILKFYGSLSSNLKFVSRDIRTGSASAAAPPPEEDLVQANIAENGPTKRAVSIIFPVSSPSLCRQQERDVLLACFV